MGSNRNDDVSLTREADLRPYRLLVSRVGLPIVALVILRATIFDGTVLLTQVPQVVKLLSYFTGFAIGSVLGIGLWKFAKAQDNSVYKAAFAAFAAVPLTIAATTYLSRWGFEAIAFSFSASETQTTDLRISDLMSGKSGSHMYLMLNADSREVDVRTTYERFAELAAIRPPLWSLSFDRLPFCVTLPVQRGRWGTMRAFIPRLWEPRITLYHSCATGLATGPVRPAA